MVRGCGCGLEKRDVLYDMIISSQLELPDCEELFPHIRSRDRMRLRD